MNARDSSRVVQDTLRQGRLACIAKENLASALRPIEQLEPSAGSPESMWAETPTFLSRDRRAESVGVQLKSGGRGSGGAGFPPSSTPAAAAGTSTSVAKPLIELLAKVAGERREVRRVAGVWAKLRREEGRRQVHWS